MLDVTNYHGAQMPVQNRSTTGNLLLDLFEPEIRARMEPFQSVDVKVGTVICESGSKLDYVYFPAGAVLSLLTVLEDGSEIETANIGSEGAYGLFHAIYGRPSFNRCVVQMQGRLLRISIKQILKGFDASEHTRKLLLGYSDSQIAQIQQSVACNARHSTEERISRWLLMMNDRAPGKELPYTHEFLSSMLGANRKSITLAAQALQTDGLIKYHRGKISIVNRKGLEEAACECYGVVKRFSEYHDLPASARDAAKSRNRSR